MLAMPVGVLLVGVRGVDDGAVVERASDELDAEGKFVFAETAGDAERG